MRFTKQDFQFVSIKDLSQAGAEIVSLQQNPFDLRPAIQAIMKKIQQQREVNPESRIVVMVGEDHSIVSHKILQSMLLIQMARKYTDTVGAAFEIAHNVVDVIGRHRPLSGEQQSALQIIMNNFQISTAPVSHKTLLGTCHKLNIAQCFADAARCEDDEYLDLEDTANREIVGDLNQTADSIFIVSSLGIVIRNIVMADNIENFMNKQKRDVVAAFVGAAHVASMKGVLSTKGRSLSRFLASKPNTHIIPVIPICASYRLSQMDSDNLPHLRDAVILTDMDETLFEVEEGMKVSKESMAAEVAHIQHLYKQSHPIPK